MNYEVKIPEDRLVNLISHENVLAELLDHLHQNRKVSTAYSGSEVVEKTISYNIDSAVIDGLLINHKKGFKEEIADERESSIQSNT